jgi:hypothetical protein
MQEEAGRMLKELINHPWWKRIWSVQEPAMLPNCHVFWGPLDIDGKVGFKRGENLAEPRLVNRGQAVS